MNLRELEERVAAVEPSPGVEYLEALLLACGFSKMTVSRLISGSLDKAETPHERLLKGKVYFRSATVSDEELYPLIDAAREDARVLKHAPRFLIVKNESRLLAVDLTIGDPLDIAVQDLGSRAEFFAPWIGIEKTQLENTNYADVKAAEKMAKLYDEVIKHNSIETEADFHDLNVFFSRLLFCFFAEDTGVFGEGTFTNAIGSYTQAGGEDTHEFLDQLFRVLDCDFHERDGVPEYLKGFGYVNGNLFARRSPAPRFSAKARAVILECGTLDWSQINPDIFGSMIQAVVHPSQREGLGMHYTSVENIMKVIRPLFLDDLEEAFGEADTTKQLNRLLDRIADIQIFDPACGSGNFLVISYKELRRLEHRILQRLIELDPKGRSLFADSKLRLENFYGIEIDDFAHEIAILSLWLAKHQMNVEFEELFGAEIPLIPLRDSGNVVWGNAARMQWEGVCDPAEHETYVCGNPPYQGARLQSAAQKADLGIAAGEAASSDLDYVSAWFFQGASYVTSTDHAALAFVATNSICQGQHVALLWPYLYSTGADIDFAVQAFRWANHAKGGAGVTCVIVGLKPKHDRAKRLFDTQALQSVRAITPYLTAGSSRTIVRKSAHATNGLPEMTFGSMANDGGALMVSTAERAAILAEHPEAVDLFRKVLGAREFLRGEERWTLWISDHALPLAQAIPPIAARLERVARTRRGSKRAATAQLASTPHRYGEVRHRDASAVLVPRHSSEKRSYIPLGFVDKDTIISDAANAVYAADPWLFGLLQSRTHMIWCQGIAGRIKTDLRYSASLVYNTFPVPSLSKDDRARVASAAVRVLAARERFSDQSLASLYDDQAMPAGLRAAHVELDDCVAALYGGTSSSSSSQQLEVLLRMYDALIAESEPAHA